MPPALASLHRDLLEAVIAQAPDAIVYADRAGVIRLWNAAAERLFGHAAADAIGSSLDIMIPERFRDAHWRGYRQAVESGAARYAGRVMTTKGLRADGSTVYVDLSFGLIRGALGAVAGVLAIGRPNTARSQPKKS